MSSGGNVLVVVAQSSNEWGDTTTRKIRISFNNRGLQGGCLSFTGKELQHALLEIVHDTMGLSPDKESVVEIYDQEEQRFIALTSKKLWNVDIAPRYGRLLRCNIHVPHITNRNTSASCESSKAAKQSTPPLAIMGRYFHHDPNGVDFCGKRLIVKERSNDLSEDGTGLNVWDGSLLLSRYLEANPAKVRGKRVLELGAGPGYVGIASGLVGAAEVVLTDLAYAIPLMKENVERNLEAAKSSGCRRMDCQVLDWFKPPSDLSAFGFSAESTDGNTGGMHSAISQPDVVVLADCVWIEELVGPLLNGIKTILQQCNPAPDVIISYQQRGRSAHEAFIGGLKKLFTAVHEINDTSVKIPDVLFIFECHMKK